MGSQPIISKALRTQDLSSLSAEERATYASEVCGSLGLNPLTKPFAFLKNRNGELVLYALKDCTDQLRTIHAISIEIKAREVLEGVYVVTATANRPDGRRDESTGAVAIDGKKGDDRANAMMKAETKAKRRATLSICGLGMLDESEVDTPALTPIPDDQPSAQRNTPEQQAKLAEKRIAETKAEAEVPAPLRVIFQGLDKPGYVKQGLELLKNRLVELSPEFGATAYRGIVERFELKSGTKLEVVKRAMLAMWELGDKWAAEKTAEHGISDADLPHLDQATLDYEAKQLAREEMAK